MRETKSNFTEFLFKVLTMRCFFANFACLKADEPHVRVACQRQIIIKKLFNTAHPIALTDAERYH
ncbi:MAG: hypothetical protein K2O56_07840, partial [Muribaculaceae bacterium]|nr:hypothetical protein [Muribaculaceae bacterium]